MLRSKQVEQSLQTSLSEFNQRKTYRMNLFKKLCGVVSLALIGAFVMPVSAQAQSSARMKQILVTESLPEKSLAVELLKLDEDYDSTAKYAVSCSIYVLDYSFLSVTINVLSTYKVNACDPDLFQATTSASVKAQLNTYQSIDRVVPVGPHVQLMDRNTSTVANPYLSIGLLNFSKIANAHLGFKDLFTNLRSWKKWRSKVTVYNPIKMSENTDYVWLPGSKIYTLTTDTGVVFVMSHFLPNGIGGEIKGIEETAANLSQFLNLPEGWRYEVKTLQKILNIRRQEDLGHTTLRVFDEYSNAYIAVDAKID